LKAGIGSSAFPTYRCGAAKRQSVGQPGILTGDLGDFIVKEVEQGQHIGHLVNVAY
jgi:hypothetical protein